MAILCNNNQFIWGGISMITPMITKFAKNIERKEKKKNIRFGRIFGNYFLAEDPNETVFVRSLPNTQHKPGLRQFA
jgi:hypothetical protein